MASKGKLKGYALEQQKLRKQLGIVEYERQKAEKKLNKTARETAVKFVEDERQNMIFNITNTMQCAMVVSLDKKGIPKDTIREVLADINLQLHCVVDGLITREEVHALAVDLGFEIC